MPGAVLERLERPDQTASMTRGSGGAVMGGAAAAAARSLTRAMRASLSKIEDAPLRLNSMVISHTFAVPDELLQTLVTHYRGQVCAYGYLYACVFFLCVW